MPPVNVSKLILASASAWGCVVLAIPVNAAPNEDAILADDECAIGEECALNALQLRAAGRENPEADPFKLGEPLIADALPEWDDPAFMGWPDDPEVEAAEAIGEPGGLVESLSAESYSRCRHGHSKRCALYSKCRGRRYCIFGGYMVVPGTAIAGTEGIHGGNARQYDYLFGVARGRCGDPRCVIMTNPLGHRTQDQLHVHYRHYVGLGPSMKARLEAATCRRGGWVPFSTGCCGCGYSKARAYSYFPGVFSEVAHAFGGGSLGSVAISVWFGCGRTIILASTHCSIEHSVSVR